MSRGAERIAPRLSDAVICAANLAEALSKVAERGNGPAYVAAELLAYGMRVDPVTEALALDAAALRPLTKHLGLSLGDRLCLALARSLNLPVLTTDRIWLQHDFGIL